MGRRPRRRSRPGPGGEYLSSAGDPLRLALNAAVGAYPEAWFACLEYLYATADDAEQTRLLLGHSRGRRAASLGWLGDADL